MKLFRIKGRFNVSWSATKFNELVYLFSISIYIFASVVRQSFYLSIFPNALYILIVLICLALMAVGECVRFSWNVKEVCGIIILASISVIILNRGFTAFPIFLFVMFGRNVNFDKIARCISLILLASIAFIIISSFIGIIPDYISKSASENGLRIRHFLGFRYSLSASALVFNAVALQLYSYRQKFSWIRWGMLFALTYWIFNMTDARLNFYLTILVMLIFLILNFAPKISEHIKVATFFAACAFPICAAISFGITLYYGNRPLNSYMIRLNAILEERLRLGYDAFQTYPVNMFGNNVVFIGNGLTVEGKKMVGIYNYVDSYYENLLLRYGLIVFASVCILWTLTSFILRKNKQYELLAIMAIIAGHGILDDGIINLQANTFMILIGICVFAKNNMLNSFKSPLYRIKPQEKRLIRFSL